MRRDKSLFFKEEKHKKMDQKDYKTVTVVGCGTMGPGITQTFARAGLEVFMVDLRQEILDQAMKKIRDQLDLFIELDVISKKDKDPILSRIHPTTGMESACRQADYFMEVVPEVLEIKQKVHKQADQWCRPETIFASNASGISITAIGTATRRPGKVVGTHWVNPPHIMQLVEIVQGDTTTNETVTDVRAFLTRIGKAPIVCKDTTSYLNNYMQGAIGRAAMELWQKGVATPEDIDRAVNTGFGFRLPIVGPLAFFDMAGLDNVRDSWEYTNKVDPGRLGPIALDLLKLVEKGDWGIKTGKGIYDYSGKDGQEIVKTREKLLILQLKALGRI
ncbi:MAG: 3-hydroxybutyryl-CoA dehydrogenase [Deltaproteobacteria bacterium]|jgi:3-hydroxyacyl-CoA dehydrogenase|nr:3-hydroxybutyryl-CoA dehydrogenase [Deltaproteobacteria bacterium]MBP1717822.1 3-hydroxybutyryl-CoA dehydrogenase [Deltaproteobacteria bacterium]